MATEGDGSGSGKSWTNSLKTVGLILSLPVAGITIYNWVAPKIRTELIANVEYAPWDVPPYFRSMTKAVPDLSGSAHVFTMEGVVGQWRMKVTNRSARELSGLTLHIPGATAAVIDRLGSPSVDTVFDALLALGVLRPRASINLKLWATDLQPPDPFEQIELTHAAGVGSVRKKVPVGRVGQIAEDLLATNPTLTIVMTLLIGTGVLSSLMAWQVWSSLKRSRAEVASRKDATP